MLRKLCSGSVIQSFSSCPPPPPGSLPLSQSFWKLATYSCLSIPHTQSSPFLATLKVLSKSPLRANPYINVMSTDLILLAPGYIRQRLKTFLLSRKWGGRQILVFSRKNYQTQMLIMPRSERPQLQGIGLDLGNPNALSEDK